MKKTLLVLALAGLAFACKSTEAELAATPDADACCADAACDGDADCSMSKSDCEGAAGCAKEGEAKVCPVTGKTTN